MTQRIALVTGAGSGINREVALRQALRGPVAVCDLDGDAAESVVGEIQAAGGSAQAWAIDVADHGAVRAVVSEVADRFGGIDVLVNGAGYGQFIDFLDMTEEDWDRMLAVHAKGTFNFTQATVPLMRDKGYGRIVCFASVGAFSGSKKHAHYAAAKGAIVSFTKALCKEIGPWGITINCVAPGAIETPFLDAVSDEVLELYRQQTPVGRMGTPADIAHTVEYLSDPEAGFITGWVVSPNGGVYT